MGGKEGAAIGGILLTAMYHIFQSLGASVTRLGDIFVVWTTFKTCGNDFLAQIAHIIGLFLKKCHFSSQGIFGQLFTDIGQL